MIALCSFSVALCVFLTFQLSLKSRLHNCDLHTKNSRHATYRKVTSFRSVRSDVVPMSAMQASTSLDQLRMCLAAGLTVPLAVREIAQLKDAHPHILWLDHEFSKNPTGALASMRERDVLFSGAAHLLERSFVTGAPLNSALGTLSDQLRSSVTQAVTRKVRAVGVKAVMPLGLCFLPAFVLLTVVPIAVGLFQQIDV